MPKLERKAEPPKKKEKAAKGAVTAVTASAKGVAKAAQETVANAVSSAKESVSKKDKKEKKEAKEKVSVAEPGAGKKAGGKNAPAAEDSGEPVPSMVDLRVGHIVEGAFDFFICLKVTNRYFVLVQKHPDADGLYIEVRII